MWNFNLKKSMTWISLCAAVATITPISTRANDTDDGGSSGGGGHEIEAGFKAAALSLADELSQLSDEAKKSLKGFDVDDLKATLNARGAFRPLCATGDTLNAMMKEEKMARVYPDHPNVVNLDCRNYKLADWKQIFDSDKLEDKLFILHESLRILKSEDENDYHASSSYLAALKTEEKIDRDIAKKMLFPSEHAKCRMEVNFVDYDICHGTEYGKYCFALNGQFLVNGVSKWSGRERLIALEVPGYDPSHAPDYHTSDVINWVKNQIASHEYLFAGFLTDSNPVNDGTMGPKELAALARDNDCLSEVALNYGDYDANRAVSQLAHGTSSADSRVANASAKGGESGSNGSSVQSSTDTTTANPAK